MLEIILSSRKKYYDGGGGRKRIVTAPKNELELLCLLENLETMCRCVCLERTKSETHFCIGITTWAVRNKASEGDFEKANIYWVSSICQDLR